MLGVAAVLAQSEFEPLTDMKPTRRVRDNPGGKDSIGSLWDEVKPGEFDFKPTRRVRQGPGGKDSVSEVSLCLLSPLNIHYSMNYQIL